MNIPTFVFGILATAFGLVTIVMRQVKPESFRKLRPMQEKFGKNAGTIVHFVSYSLLPLVLGILAMIAGWRGVSVF